MGEAPKLPHTERVADLIAQGKRDEAGVLHNAHLAAEFERAEAGETINLSDLMAAKEQLDVAEEGT